MKERLKKTPFYKFKERKLLKKQIDSMTNAESQAALDLAKKEEKERRKLKKVHTIEFEKMDVNGDKALSPDELHAGLTRGCLQGKYDQDEIQEMFGKLDANGDGHVSLDEYLDYFIIQDFDKQVKGITDTVLGPFREVNLFHVLSLCW